MKERKRHRMWIWIPALLAVAAAVALFWFIRFGSSGGDHRTEDFKTDLFGENVYVFSPQDDPAQVQAVLDSLWSQQETNQFGDQRYAVLFLPGTYDPSISVRVGYYMQVSGLGALPTDTVIPSLRTDARWLGGASNHNATCNFWRGVENLTMDSDTMWAVSQATFMRRVVVNGNLAFHDEHGWASGGFLSDSVVNGVIDSGSQQQWETRNCAFEGWTGSNWNLVFTGNEPGSDPEGDWPEVAYTRVEKTPVIGEKPFLYYDTEKQQYMVFVPDVRTDCQGISWKNGNVGAALPLETEFYIAHADKDTSESLNKALKQGKNLLFTPGIYRLDQPLEVEGDAIVLGMGLATLMPTSGNECIVTRGEGELTLAGLLFDAGPEKSGDLLIVGQENEKAAGLQGRPTVLADLFFRVGGAYTSYDPKVDRCITINRSYVVGDNFWVWRADHSEHVAWDENTADNGLVVNGDDVTIYALMVEHFQKYQTVWNGERGRIIMYQSELPYDVPDSHSWWSTPEVPGYASIHVDDSVTQFEGWGIGIYSYFRDSFAEENRVMEVPDVPGVKVHNTCAIMITGYPGIHFVINQTGGSCINGGDRQIIREYCQGIVEE